MVILSDPAFQSLKFFLLYTFILALLWLEYDTKESTETSFEEEAGSMAIIFMVIGAPFGYFLMSYLFGFE